MLSCVYSTDKLKKKKKWLDGFVETNGTTLRLFNEERHVISSKSSFRVLEDSNIEAGSYLILVDESELPVFTSKRNREEEPVVDLESRFSNLKEANTKRETNTKRELNTKREVNKKSAIQVDREEEEESNKEIERHTESIKGRTKEDIFDLLQRK